MIRNWRWTHIRRHASDRSSGRSRVRPASTSTRRCNLEKVADSERALRRSAALHVQVVTHVVSQDRRRIDLRQSSSSDHALAVALRSFRGGLAPRNALRMFKYRTGVIQPLSTWASTRNFILKPEQSRHLQPGLTVSRSLRNYLAPRARPRPEPEGKLSDRRTAGTNQVPVPALPR